VWPPLENFYEVCGLFDGARTVRQAFEKVAGKAKLTPEIESNLWIATQGLLRKGCLRLRLGDLELSVPHASASLLG
jgi:hypothetical protein